MTTEVACAGPSCARLFRPQRFGPPARYCSEPCRAKAAYRRNPRLRHDANVRWRDSEPLRYRASQAVSRSNRHAAERGATGILTMQDVLDLWERQPVCVTCGVGRGIDHIVALLHGGTHTADNIQTMCRTCNRAKGPNRRPWPTKEAAHVAA